MESSLLILSLLAALSSACALALFVYWLVSGISDRVMVTGQSDAKSSGRRDDVKAIVRLLLPTVARWRANDTLGFQKLLPEIEGKLVRAGLRRLQTPEAFVAQSLLGVICVVGALLIIGLVLMLAAGTSLLTVLFLCLMGAAVAWIE